MPEPKSADLFRTANEIPPRGDIFERVEEFVSENLKPTTIAVEDPVSGVVAPCILIAGELKPIPSSVFNDYLEGPRRRTGKAVMTSLASFIDHVNRFKDEHTAVFANDDRKSPSLTAVLDYNPGGDAGPRHGNHRTAFAFPLSEEWKAWREIDGVNMNLVTFAKFIEDRISDVLAPSSVDLTPAQAEMVGLLGGKSRIATPASLFELSRGLAVRENAQIKESHKLESGEGELTFTEEHTDFEGRPLTVPTTILIGLPVFKSGAPYQILARLRYSVKGGLSFKIELWRVDLVFDDAFGEAVEQVKHDTSAAIFIGAPEA